MLILGFKVSLSDFLHKNKLFAIILPMRMKERESETPMVYFRTRSCWLWLTLEAAEECSKLDFNDWQSFREVWGRTSKWGIPSSLLTIVFSDKRMTDFSMEVLERFTPGSWISSDGRSFFEK